jgi:hypothetical protein
VNSSRGEKVDGAVTMAGGKNEQNYIGRVKVKGMTHVGAVVRSLGLLYYIDGSKLERTTDCYEVLACGIDNKMPINTSTVTPIHNLNVVADIDANSMPESSISSNLVSLHKPQNEGNLGVDLNNLDVVIVNQSSGLGVNFADQVNFADEVNFNVTSGDDGHANGDHMTSNGDDVTTSNEVDDGPPVGLEGSGSVESDLSVEFTQKPEDIGIENLMGGVESEVMKDEVKEPSSNHSGSVNFDVEMTQKPDLNINNSGSFNHDGSSSHNGSFNFDDSVNNNGSFNNENSNGSINENLIDSSSSSTIPPIIQSIILSTSSQIPSQITTTSSQLTTRSRRTRKTTTKRIKPTVTAVTSMIEDKSTTFPVWLFATESTTKSSSSQLILGDTIEEVNDNKVDEFPCGKFYANKL